MSSCFILLEDGSGFWALEDGSGLLLLEDCIPSPTEPGGAPHTAAFGYFPINDDDEVAAIAAVLLAA